MFHYAFELTLYIDLRNLYYKKITEIAINIYHKFMEKMNHIFGECVSFPVDLYLDIGMQ